MKILILGGLIAGLLAGLLGIGGGTLLVPLLVGVGYTSLQAVGTSSLAIAVISLSGTLQNWRSGFIDWSKVLGLAIPALVTTQAGVYIANLLPERLLLIAFGILLLINIFLSQWRRSLEKKEKAEMAAQEDSADSEKAVPEQEAIAPVKQFWSRVLTGGLGGLLAGIFGVGGGVVMVPLQMILLREAIKPAIQTSLGVIILTSISATLGHAIKGNVLWQGGFVMGLFGAIAVQGSTRYLPKLPDYIVSFSFNALLSLLAAYMFGKAWH